nr:MAG TPA: hypothetical protein [Caudoviricetes sp.]DAV21912.1 MAG TPA: hypothetical protein [Caudoviricetes sp.]
MIISIGQSKVINWRINLPKAIRAVRHFGGFHFF